MCNKTVKKNPCLYSEVSDHLKKKEMCEKVVEDSPWHLIDVPDHLKTQ